MGTQEPAAPHRPAAEELVVSEWTVHIESRAGAIPPDDEDAITRFQAAITAEPAALDPASVYDVREQRISSTFQVEATALEDAQDIGIAVFLRALGVAGLPKGWDVVEASPFEGDD
jgi:hypothetical protein